MMSLDDLTYVGSGLDRPECVIATSRGEIFVSDRTFGVVEVGARKVPVLGAPADFLPNGFALTSSRDYLVASLNGGVWRLDAKGTVTPYLRSVDGLSLGVANFVEYDALGRIWISVSTRCVPRDLAYRPDCADGFVVLVDRAGPRIVLDGLQYTNECKVDPTGQWLYVNETMGRRLCRYRIEHSESPRLGAREVVHEFLNGDFPDGMAFDEEGGVWVVCVISNRVVRIDVSGRLHVVVEENDASAMESAERHFRTGTMTREVTEKGPATRLKRISSIAFGGANLKTVYLGSLAGDSLPTFQSPVAGAKPAHWNF